MCASQRLPPKGTLSTLLRAVEQPDPRTVREILSRHPDLARARLYDENQDGDTLLHRADAGIELPRDDRGWSLEDGTTDAHLEVARLLIRHGAPVDAMGGSGNTVGETPLGAAAWAGNLRMCRLLLEHGADPNHVTERGFDALGTAADHRKTAIVEAMIAAGARYEPRHLLQCGLKERLDRLLDREPERLHERIDLGHFNGESGTLLHVAVNEGLDEMVALLLARGADLEARDDRGWTVVSCALEPSHTSRSAAIIDLLRRHGARIDADEVSQ
jgi:ankyrin repeat protein